MKKIAFVISSLDLGGAQRAVSSITSGLPEDYSIDIILNDDSNIVYPYRGNIHSLKIENPEDRTNLLFQLRVFFKRIRFLRKIKKANKYDAVVSFLDSANFANILSGKRYCKTIVSVRINLSESKNWKYRLIVGNLVRLLYNKADLIVSLSEGVKEDLVKNFKLKEDKTVTIYNGYDIDSIEKKADQPTTIPIDHDYVNFVTMGRLTHQKGQWHLIRAFAELYKKNNNARLYILGIGELESYLKLLIKDYHLEQAVFLTGFLDNSYAALSKMDVFVFPSLYEGFGNALVEAMACGLPCISADYESGAREILSDHADFGLDGMKCTEYGIITPKTSDLHQTSTDELDQSETEMIKAMQMLLDDKQLRDYYSRKSRERAKFFSLKNAVLKWEEVL